MPFEGLTGKMYKGIVIVPLARVNTSMYIFRERERECVCVTNCSTLQSEQCFVKFSNKIEWNFSMKKEVCSLRHVLSLAGSLSVTEDPAFHLTFICSFLNSTLVNNSKVYFLLFQQILLFIPPFQFFASS